MAIEPKQADEALEIIIPRGTMLRSVFGCQNMLIREETTVMITKNNAKSLMDNKLGELIGLSTYCCNFYKSIPQNDDRFELVETADDNDLITKSLVTDRFEKGAVGRRADLRKLIAHLKKEETTIKNYQTAFWIIERDMILEDLKRLSIHENKILAMKLCVDLGINICKYKAFWDREEISKLNSENVSFDKLVDREKFCVLCKEAYADANISPRSRHACAKYLGLKWPY